MDNNKMTAEQALDAVRNVLQRAYNSAEPVCCGRAGTECCGSPEPEWSEYDQQIMNDLQPVEEYLSQALSAPRVHAAILKWVASHPPELPDHACAECAPHSDCIKPGFQCGYHLATAMLAASPEPVAPRVPDWKIDWSKAPAGTERAIDDESIVTWLKMSPGRGVMSWHWHSRSWYLHTNTDVANAMWESAIPKPEPGVSEQQCCPNDQQLIADLRAEVEALKAARNEIIQRLSHLEREFCFDDRWEILPSGHHGRPISREKLADRMSKFDAARLREGGE